MLAARLFASICSVALMTGAALAQGTAAPPTAQAGKVQPSAAPKATTVPAAKSSKASPDPTKVDLGKQEKEKAKKAAKAACEQRCAEEFPIDIGKKSQPAKAEKDPCAGLSSLSGAYQNCKKEQLSKPSAGATSAVGGSLLSSLNKPKYDACMKKCGRSQ